MSPYLFPYLNFGIFIDVIRLCPRAASAAQTIQNRYTSSEGKINDEGYAVELKIPFKSIRYSHKEPVEMGVIFERKINRESEVGTFPALDPKQGANFLTQTVALIFHDIKHYTLFELLPPLPAVVLVR